MIFKNEDMDVTCMGNGVRHGISVNQANRIFNEWLEKQPVVWKSDERNEMTGGQWFEEKDKWWKDEMYSNKARLVAIEEIKNG